MSETVLCIDPGSTLAYSLWRDGSHEPTEYHEFKTNPKDGILSRVLSMEHNIDTLIGEQMPDVLVIEDVTKGSYKSWQARVWTIYTCIYAQVRAHQHRIKVVTFAPASLKMLLTGSGRANKIDMIHSVNRALDINLSKSKHNLADALALGIVYLKLPLARS